MRNIIKEKNKLPLFFKYIEFSKSKTTFVNKSRSIFFIKCDRYQTDYLIRSKPYKHITRLL